MTAPGSMSPDTVAALLTPELLVALRQAALRHDDSWLAVMDDDILAALCDHIDTLTRRAEQAEALADQWDEQSTAWRRRRAVRDRVQSQYELALGDCAMLLRRALAGDQENQP